MIISFAWTTPAYLAGKKTCTRRDWSDRHFAQWLKAWHEEKFIHDAYDKSPRCHGKKVGQFHLTSIPYREPLADIPFTDLEAEGGLWESTDQFIELCGGDPSRLVTVIRFRPLTPF